jgi:hypothetical protein
MRPMIPLGSFMSSFEAKISPIIAQRLLSLWRIIPAIALDRIQLVSSYLLSMLAHSKLLGQIL